MSRPYGPSNTPGTCLWCGRKIYIRAVEQKYIDERSRPYRWDTYFCTQRCGLSFGVVLAKAGRRLEPAAPLTKPTTSDGKGSP